MDLIKDLGPSGSDNEDDEPDEGLIIIPPQCNTPDSPSVGKIVLPKGLAAAAESKGSAQESLFRQSVKNKLKAFTEGRLSLPGSPKSTKSASNKKDLKLTKCDETIDENGTSAVHEVKTPEINPAAKCELDIPSTEIAVKLDALTQNEVSFESSIDIDVNQGKQDIQAIDIVEPNTSNKTVPKTNSIEGKDNKIKTINTYPYPKSWSEIKTQEIDLNILRNHKDNSINKEQKTTFDFREQLLFKSPANLLNGLNYKSVDNKPNQRVAPQYVRYTNTSPKVTWSCNPLVTTILTRSEIFEYIPSIQKVAIEKLVELKTSLKSTDKKPINKWYTKMPLLLCESENSSFEPVRLSFLYNSSDNEVKEDGINTGLTPKLPEDRLIAEETKLLKKAKKRNKKRSRSTTEDEEYTRKKRSKSKTKKHRKDKKKKTLDKLEGNKEKSIEDFLEISEVLVDAPPKKRSKSSELTERTEKQSKLLKGPNKPVERNERSSKYLKSKSKKNRSKSKSQVEQSRGKNPYKVKATPSEAEGSHTPKTEEYHSRWESDEELLKLERHVKKKYKHRSSSKNMSWESDDDNHDVNQKYHHRSAADRSLDMPLEMPLTITHVSRHRSTPKCNENSPKQKRPQAFYSEDSWERGEYLKIKNELDNLELQKGRQTLSEERRQLEIEKKKIAEMEQRLTEQKLKLQQDENPKEPVNVESKEKRYFENIGLDPVGDIHETIVDSKRKSRWETSKENVEIQEKCSPPLQPVSTSPPLPFNNSPSPIDVDNYSPKATEPAVLQEEIPAVLLEVPIELKSPQTTDELVEDIQLPTSTSNEPGVVKDSEKVVELENEYEQFMMSLANDNDTDDVAKASTGDSIKSITSSGEESSDASEVSLVPKIRTPLIINAPLTCYSGNKNKPRVPITILETIIIEDDDVPIIQPEIDLSKIELPPQISAVIEEEAPINHDVVVTCDMEIESIPEELVVEEPPVPEEILPPPPPPPPPPPLEVPKPPAEDNNSSSSSSVKRNNLISIKFLSPRKRALEMSSTIGTDASDGDDDRSDSVANTKRLFSSFNEPLSPPRPLDTRPQLITVEQKAKLDAMRNETVEQIEQCLVEKPEVAVKEKALEQPEVVVKEKALEQPKEKRSSSERQRKDSGSDRKKYGEGNKRRSSKEREPARKRSVSPMSKRRRVSPNRGERSDRDRDRDRDRQRRSSPRRGDKDRDRRDGKMRRSRSRSPPKSKGLDRRRSRDKSPKHRSGDRERDRRDSRRVSSPRSRKRSPSPSNKRRSGHRERSRSTDRERKKERIEDTLKRLAGIDPYKPSSNTSHKSPRSSPLDGFKRSLADSTISDDQLLLSITQSPNIHSKHSPKSDYYKFGGKSTVGDYYGKHDAPKPRVSPKRPSLDDRINQVLGLEKGGDDVEDAPRRISTTYEGQYDYKYAYPEYRGYSGGEMKADDGSRLVQMGNVLQVVPASGGGGGGEGDSSRSRSKDHSSHHHHQSHSSSSSSSTHRHHHPPSQQQILQVGNMLQIVPTVLPTVAAPPSSVPAAVSAVALPPPPAAPIAEQAATVAENVLTSAEELLQQQHAQRKAEKEVRRHERDRRRKEKEIKQKEREKKKALRVKTKTEDMIKRALLLETEENGADDDNSEVAAAVIEEPDEELKWSPSNPILAGALANLAKPVGKSILTSEKLSKLNVTKALELLTESRKQVKFADGIIPGEGTSPSAGEELTSPPPSDKRAFKEKRHAKSLLSKAVRNKLSKKKVKVKVVHSKKHSRNNTNPSSNPPNPNNVPQQSPTDADLENLPPPSPPPGSPPPHIFPARVKPPPPPNNIHTAAAAAYLHHPSPITATPHAYSYAMPASPATIMYGAPVVGVPSVYAAQPPPPPPPPIPSAVAGVNGRYGASIPALPPTHQLPHHLALRAGASHKSRQ